MDIVLSMRCSRWTYSQETMSKVHMQLQDYVQRLAMLILTSTTASICVAVKYLFQWYSLYVFAGLHHGKVVLNRETLLQHRSDNQPGALPDVAGNNAVQC